MPLVRLPLAPQFVAGVVNLRGRVTPCSIWTPCSPLERDYRYTPQSFIINLHR